MNHFPELEAAENPSGPAWPWTPTTSTPASWRPSETRGIQVRIHWAGRPGPPAPLRSGRRGPQPVRTALPSAAAPSSWPTSGPARALATCWTGSPPSAARTSASRSMARVALANYFAARGAHALRSVPAGRQGRALRHRAPGRRFQASFEQVCHRLTTLRRPGAEGVPFHFLRIDIAGNISKSFSASGIRFARFSGCLPPLEHPRRLPHPGPDPHPDQRDARRPEVLLHRPHPAEGHGRLPRPARHAGPGAGLRNGPRQGARLRRWAGLDQPPVPIGVTCRLCERTDCEQRAFPPMQQAFKVEENLRRTSFYAQIEGT